MYSAEELKELVEKSLKGIQSTGSRSDLYAPVIYSLSIGGKRIRPVLALLSCNLFTDRITDKCVLPAAALEMFHCSTLIHDDIMDNADLRRGHPTIHKKWNINTAILAGDVMYAEACKLMNYAETSKLPEVLAAFNNAVLQVYEGQQYDMNFETKNTVTDDDYLMMIELKTAALISAATRLGAIVGGASTSEIDRMAKIGVKLGLAFQIQDDIMDAYSDTKKTGKDTGLDIVNNKKTFLLISALKLAKGDRKKQLLALIANENNIAAEEKVNEVKAIYNELEIKELADAKVRELFNTADSELKAVDVKVERKQYFKEFIDNLFTRQK
jgi:geranylgeranyl diphosphate synthase type II